MDMPKRFRSPRSKYTMITKIDWRSMMRKFSWMLLVLLVFSVYAEDEKEVGGGSVKGKKKPFLAASLSSGICRWNFSASRYGADL